MKIINSTDQTITIDFTAKELIEISSCIQPLQNIIGN